MATIINNSDFTLSPASQQVVHNAAANYGTDKVYVQKRILGKSNAIWDIYDAETMVPGYIATLDTEGDTIHHKADKP
jgi:hypothetical protein